MLFVPFVQHGLLRYEDQAERGYMENKAHWSWPETYKTSDWTSSDGNDWLDAGGKTVPRSALEASTIRFVGGPRHGQTITYHPSTPPPLSWFPGIAVLLLGIVGIVVMALCLMLRDAQFDRDQKHKLLTDRRDWIFRHCETIGWDHCK
jgi:hypothetical protein